MHVPTRQLLITAAALTGMLQVGAANASACDTPDLSTTVPSTSTCYFDLTQSPSSTAPAQALLNGGIFRVPDASGSFGGSPVVGTGVLNPFVRIQEPASGGPQSNGIEAGFNTSADVKNTGAAAGTLLDDHDNGNTNWNHAIRLGDIGTVTVGGIQYYDFILDVNEQGNSTNSGISLDEFKVFFANSGTLKDFTGNNDTLGASNFDLTGATLAYNMDGPTGGNSGVNTTDCMSLGISGDCGGDASILMDYKNFSGSGLGVDLSALVPVANFVNADGTVASADSYVYLYSKFGATGNKCKTGSTDCPFGNNVDQNGNPIDHTHAGKLNYAADAGFEEWSVRSVPEPETLALMGIGLIGFLLRRRPRRLVAAAA